MIILGAALLPDAVEYDYLRTGMRREATMSAFYATVEKLAFAAGPALALMLLSAFGYQSGTAGMQIEQPDSAITAIYFSAGLAPALLYGVSLVFLFRYDLTEEKLKATRGRQHGERITATERLWLSGSIEASCFADPLTGEEPGGRGPAARRRKRISSQMAAVTPPPPPRFVRMGAPMKSPATRLILAASILTLLPLGIAHTPALAQEAVLEEIIVTARKREENLFDIPVAITAITEEQIENFGLNDLQDVAKIVPGLTFDRSVTQNDYAPALRGLQAEQGRNSVGLLIDDIDISSQNLQVAGGGSLARLRLVDIERIEVVKGPQAALYGRSAFGGALNYITKRPSLNESDLKAGFEVHSESGQELTVSGGAPLIEDTLGVRVNAYYFDERGIYRNEVSDAYVGGGDGVGLSGAFLLQASENFSVYGRLEFSEESYAPQAAFVINGNTDVNLVDGAEIVLSRATTRIFSGPLVDGPIGFDINHRTGQDYKGMDVEYFRATVIADWDAGNIGLKSLTSWVDSNDDIFQDNDFVSGSVNGVVTGAFQETERITDTAQLSQELRIFSQTDSRFQWLLGALYWKEDVEQFGSNDTGSALGPLFDSDVAAFYDTRDGEGRHVKRYTDHQSVFAWGEYALSEKLFASAEVRYTDEEIEHILDFEPPFGFFFGVRSTGGTTPPVLIPFGAVTGYHSETIEEKYAIPRVALSYRPDDNLNLYAAIGKGIKPSGFQDGAVFSLDRPFDRESLWSYELGAKALLMGGALAFNGAVFYPGLHGPAGVVADLQRRVAAVAASNRERGVNQPIWGIELEANWRASEALTLVRRLHVHQRRIQQLPGSVHQRIADRRKRLRRVSGLCPGRPAF